MKAKEKVGIEKEKRGEERIEVKWEKEYYDGRTFCFVLERRELNTGWGNGYATDEERCVSRCKN